ncbi:MAG: Imm8 family immunity protein [Bacteroidales bacterium]
MKSEIKYLHSPDVYELSSFSSIKPDNFGFLIQVMVGIEGEGGEESFDIMLCTPKWIEENYKKERFILGLHYIIMFEYNYQLLYNKLQELFCIEGKDWEEIATKLSYIGHWEFQDYQEYIEE